MIDYAAIKAAVTVRDAAIRYGITVGRDGMALCPFHGEKTPSMKIYPGDRGFYCFGCGAGGDVIKFTAMLFDLSSKEAAEKLDEDFGLGLAGKPFNAAAALLREAEERLRREDEARRKELVRILCAKRFCLWIHRFDPRGHNPADMDFLDYVIDNFDDFSTKELIDIARRIPRVN